MTRFEFTKMHGLGNDFVIVDERAGWPPSAAQIQAMSDRRRGIGCDQFLTLRAPTVAGAAVRMDIHNPDGSVAEACGNGTRCVAALLMEKSGAAAVTIETLAGQLDCRRADDGQIAVDMGPVQLAAADIPLAEDVDSAHVPLANAPYSDACCVGVGNPHAVFFVADVEAVDLAVVGPRLETHPMFPARANIEFVAVVGRDHLRMRVWERAAGITQACGSGACASAVAAARRGLTGRAVTVDLDGGRLHINWRDDDHVIMAGPTALSFSGVIDVPGA